MTPDEMKAAAVEVRETTIARIKQFEEETGKTMTDLAAAQAALKVQVETKGNADPETREKVEKLWQRIDQIDAKLTAPGNLAQRAPEHKTIGTMLTEHPDFQNWKKSDFTSKKAMRFSFDRPFFHVGERKTDITDAALGLATSGVLPLERLPGLVQLQRRPLRIRDLFNVRTTTAAAIDWLKQNVRTNAASPQVEGSAKAQSLITYTTASAPVRTLAHFMQVTTQALSDAPWLRADIDSELMYGLALLEETEILTGDGTGQHINGILNQASAYAGTYDVAADTKLDKLRHAILEARLAFYPVDGIVLNPVDVQKLELVKDEMGGTNTGRYILGDPSGGGGVLRVWGKPVVESDAIAAGKFLVGAFAIGADLVDRMTAVIDISFEAGTNFTTNEATVRAEERLALAVKRPASFVTGSF